MLTLSATAQILLYEGIVDMRKSFEGLSALAYGTFPAQTRHSAYFVFLNRSRDRMKVLYWDGDGFVIWYKRLEKGSFATSSAEKVLTRRTFFMLLEGLCPQRKSRRYQLDKYASSK